MLSYLDINEALKVAAEVDTASTFPALQAGAHLSMPSSVKMARTTGAAPARSRSTGEY